MHKKDQHYNELLELNDELENYFRNTIIPQLFVDANLRLRKFTPPAMKQFKLHQKDIGKPIAEIQDNFRFPSITDNIEQVIRSGEILEKEIQTTDMRWYQMNILPYLVTKENRTNGVIITFVDITLRIRDLKEQEKLVLEHELLLDTIAHDIKTPLTSLTLTIDLLKKIPDEAAEKYPVLLGKIESSILKIRGIISDLTENRKSEHSYKATDELLDIEQILEDVRLTLAPQILESGAIISWEISHSEISFVRRKLRSLLYNLVNNSIKYRDPSRTPEIKVTAALDKDYVVIAVRDNGVGIPEKDIEKIFNKYERLSRDTEGAGVGLHLVKEIVTMSGGKIETQSEFGQGTLIRIFLKHTAA